jgi:hypothetical protein
MDEPAGLSDDDRKLALGRFRLLQPHLEQNRPLRAVTGEAGIAFRTAQRWVAQYQRFGLAALARKKRDDRGARRAVSSSEHGGTKPRERSGSGKPVDRRGVIIIESWQRR